MRWIWVGVLHKWDGRDLQSDIFSYLYVITFLSNFRFQEQLRTLAIRLDVIDVAFKLARAWWCYQSQPVYLGLINTTRFFRNCYFGYGANHTYCEFVGPFIQSALRPFYLGCGSNRFCLDNSLGCEVISYLHPCIIAGVLSHV